MFGADFVKVVHKVSWPNHAASRDNAKKVKFYLQ